MPSPSPSSSSGSDDFAALLDSELELASGADSGFPDDEGEDDGSEEEVEVEALEQNRYTPPNRSSLLSVY